MADAVALGGIPAAPARPSSGALTRGILALAGPTMLVVAVQSGSQLVETWLAARQGTLALAGWAVVLPFSLLLGQMSAGAMGGGVVSAIARALGGKREAEASALVLHALVIALCGGFLFALLLAVFPRTLFGVIAGPEVAAAAAGYSAWLFGAGAVPTWLANTLASVLRGGGRHALAARALVLTGLAYPPLAWVLMEPAGFGLPGAGMAYAITMTVAAVAQGWVVLAGGAGFQPQFRLRLSGALFARILSVGLLACLMATIANMTTILVTARIKSYGAAAVAAYGVSARLEFLMVPLAFGIGSALTALVGRAVGSGDWDTARRTAWSGALMALGVAGSVGVFVALFPGATANVFAEDPEVVAIATRALSYIGPAMAGFGVGMALYFAAMGAGRMTGPVTAGVARIVIAVGGGWVLGDLLGWGLDGQFLAVALGITAFGLINAAAVRPGVWSARE